MKRKYRKADWNNYPYIEEYAGAGDTNGNAMDIEIAEDEERENEKLGVAPQGSTFFKI